jgi:hypothetical protein
VEIPTPIAIFAYKRLNTLRQTLRSLTACKGFPGGPIHVFSDAAHSEQPVELMQVEAVRKWLRKWCSDHDAVLHEAIDNRGLRSSIVTGVSDVLREYEQIVVLEDDIVVSRAFLEYMHGALHHFRDARHVYQVSGYFVPHRNRLPDMGLLKVPACWGWGTWRRAWQHYCDDADALLIQLQDRDTTSFNVDGTYDYLASLRMNAGGMQDTWLVRWYASVFLRDGLSVYPRASLTRNIGFGRNGTNCSRSPIGRVFRHQRLSASVPDLYSVGELASESVPFRNALAEFFRWQQRQWEKPSPKEVWSRRFDRILRLVRR